MGETGLIGSKNPLDAIVVGWKIMLVSYDYDFQTVVGNLLYFFITVYLIIVMLNLLISIVSSTYERVNSQMKVTDFKVKAS